MRWLKNLDSEGKNISMYSGISHGISSYSCVITWHLQVNRTRGKEKVMEGILTWAGGGLWSSKADRATSPH